MNSGWFGRANATFAQLVATSERFFLPMEMDVMRNREYDEQVKEMARLPFDRICILTHRRHIEGGPMEPEIIFAQAYSNRPAPHYPEGRYIAAHSIGRFDGGWHLARVGAHARIIDEDGEGIEIWPNRLEPPNDGGSFHRPTQPQFDQDVSDSYPDVRLVISLCVLLGLHNVRQRVEAVPKALQKKRRDSSKPPLYSYRVLVVDGDCWDRSLTNGESGSGGFRSHMRRGHIRRLDESRRVWVRATLVHGSRAGFVDKEYAPNSPPPESH